MPSSFATRDLIVETAVSPDTCTIKGLSRVLMLPLSPVQLRALLVGVVGREARKVSRFEMDLTSKTRRIFYRFVFRDKSQATL